MKRVCVVLALTYLGLPASSRANDAIDIVPATSTAQASAMNDWFLRGTVATHATAHRRLDNTVADLSVSIETHGGSVAGVQRALGQKSQTLLAFLRGAGADRLRSDTIDVEPQTETDRGHGLPDRIVGYNGTLGVSFRASTDKLPDLIDGSLSHGANTVGQVTLTPTEDEIDTAKQALAAEATTLAVRQIDAVAQAARHKIVGVRSIVVDPPPPGVFETENGNDFRSQRAVSGAAPPPPPVAVAAGQSDISVTVAIIAVLDK